MLCATLAESPATSSSDREARKIAWGERKISISCPAFRVTQPQRHAKGEPMQVVVFGRESVGMSDSVAKR